MNTRDEHSAGDSGAEDHSAEDHGVDDRRDACQALALLVAGGVDDGRWHIANRLLGLLRPAHTSPPATAQCDGDWIDAVAAFVPAHEVDLVDSLFDQHRRGVLDDLVFASAVASLIIASDP